MATSPVRATYVSPSGTPYTASGVDQKSAIATATANALKDSANNGAIPASTLSSADKPATVTPPAPTTNATSMAGLLDATANQNKDSYQANLDAKAKTAEKGADTSFQAYLDSILGTEGKTSLTAKEYAATGVDQAQSDLNDITNQILAEQTASRHAQEQVLRNNPNGLGAEVLQAKADQINRDSISKQADLAVIQLAKQGKYDSAKAIADRAVAAKFEQQQVVNDALQLNYERNKDLFTTAEQRAFETAQADRNRILDTEKSKELARYDQILKQNDPLYKAQLAQLDTGTVDVTNPQAVQYSGALNTILGSAKFTKEQKADLIRSINGGEDPFTVIKNQAKNIMGQTEATKLTSYESANSAMEDLQKSLSDYYSAGGKTSLFSGTMEKTINSLGEVNDPKLVGLATQVAVSLQSYRNAISGTAYSDQEGKDIASIFPGINKSEGLNNAVINARIKASNSVIDGIYKSAIGAGTYDSLKAVNQAGAKGALSDKDFVEKSLTSIGASYNDAVAKVPSGMKAVIDNKTGQVGYIDPSEYDPKLYTSL